jgi:beta-galactosidase
MRYGIGGQIIIEPGMTEKQIDKLFQNLSNASFRYARIRMFELYMKDANGDWDFTLFDFAFKAAEKYNIDVFATLFPATRFEDIGGFKFPFTDEHFEDVKIYIKNVVPHFSKYSSCYGWVLINEPGQNNMPSEEFSEKRYQEYLLENPNLPIKENGCPGMDFSREHFMLDYTSRYLNELA